MLSTMFVGNGQKSATYGNVSRFVDGKIHRLIDFGSCYVADITTHFHLNGKDQFSGAHRLSVPSLDARWGSHSSLSQPSILFVSAGNRAFDKQVCPPLTFSVMAHFKGKQYVKLQGSISPE